MSVPEEKTDKNPNKSKEEKIYIPEEEENIEEIEEDADVEEVDEEDSQAEIQILEDSPNRKKRKKVKKDSESEYYSSEESHKDKNTSTLNENDNDNDNDNSNHLKRKRRRKKEFEGPGFTCPECGKSYFSTPALNAHRKTKHEYLRGDWGRGRGRPKKDPQLDNSGDIPQIKEIKTEEANVVSYSKIDNKMNRFFEGENRKPMYGEIINKGTIWGIIGEYKKNYEGIINELDENNNFYDKIMDEWESKKSEKDKNGENEDNMTFINLTNYKSSNDYLNIDSNNINGKQNENKKKSFDFALCKYLKECAHSTNIHFLKIIYFVLILFREGINNYFYEMKLNSTNSTANEKSEEKVENIFTDKYNCDDQIPEIINDIISKYFETNSFFGFKQKDVRDIIIHFFHWLYNYNYTDKKVTHSKNN